MYVYVKNLPGQVKLQLYRSTIYSAIIHKYCIVFGRRLKIKRIKSLPTSWYNKVEIFYNQIQKLIAINDCSKNIRKLGVKAKHSNFYCMQLYPDVYTGESIAESTCMAKYMMKNKK